MKVDENIVPCGNAGDVDYRQEFEQMKSKLCQMNQPIDTSKYVDMRDPTIASSGHNVPNFIHRLNLRLNLYEPGLKYKPLSEK